MAFTQECRVEKDKLQGTEMIPRPPHSIPVLGPKPKLSTMVHPYVLGCAALSGQLTINPSALPVKEIMRRALQLGFRAFDTSPYYGDSEILLGKALASLAEEGVYSREKCILMTKVGRVSSQVFDYSYEGVRASVQRSMERLHATYLDVVFCHDVEFVTTGEVIEAATCLYDLVAEGKIRYVGISAYPPARLLELAAILKERFGHPLDAVQSYSHFNLQNTVLKRYLSELRDIGIDVIFTGSPLSMGLLRKNGVPVAELGDFHPAPRGLREACKAAAIWLDRRGDDLASLAIRFVAANWATANEKVPGCGVVIFGGCHSIWELEENQKSLDMIIDTTSGTAKVRESQLHHDEKLWTAVRDILGDWVDYSWESPSPDWVRAPTPSTVEKIRS